MSYDDDVLRAVFELWEDGATWREIAARYGWKRGKTKHAIRAAKRLHRADTADAGDHDVTPAPTSATDTAVYAGLRAGASGAFTPTPLRRKRRPTAPRVLMRAAVYDIEVTDFGTEGWAGRMILTCILPLDAHTPQTLGIRFEDRGDDRRVMAQIAAALARYDVLIGHNIAAFDMNWLNSRLMFHGLPPMRTHQYFDTFQVAKSLGIKTRKSLGNLLDYFGLVGEKTSIYRTSWLNVLSPHRYEFEEAYQDIQYHCEQDVIGNRNLFDVMYPYALANGRTNPFKLAKMRNGAWEMVA